MRVLRLGIGVVMMMGRVGIGLIGITSIVNVAIWISVGRGRSGEDVVAEGIVYALRRIGEFFKEFFIFELVGASSHEEGDCGE